MNTLELVENADVKIVITDEDQKVCEQLQKEWENFFSYATQYIKFVESHPVEIESYNNQLDIARMKAALKNQIQYLIEKVVNHFERVYRLTLNKYILIQKYGENTEIHYTTIVEEIFKQIGNVPFQVKAEEEIKDVTQKRIELKNMVLKKKKIVLYHFMEWDDYSSEKRLNRDERNVKDIFLALSHYACDSSTMLLPLERFYWELDSFGFKHSKFDKKRVHIHKVLAVRAFKNGKMEIIFESKVHAKEFAKEYLGYFVDKSK